MKDNIISLIIPIYNAEDTISKNINRIIQEKKNYPIELILIDDGSVDKSGDICKSFLLKNSWIKYYKTENNGVSSARNKGIQIAGGEWIYFIDSDDEIKEDSISVLFKLIENATNNIIITGYDSNKSKNSNLKSTISKKTDILKLITLDTRYLKKDDDINDVFLLWTCWGKLYKRKFLLENDIKFNEELILGEDILFLLNCYDFCKEIDINFSKTYYYNNDNISLSKGFNKKRVYNTKKLANFYTVWAQKQTKEIQRAVNKFIFQRTLACISKYYLNSENNMKMKDKINDFSILCNVLEINNSIANLKYCQFFELKKITPIYIISLFLLKRKKYNELIKFYKYVRVY